MTERKTADPPRWLDRPRNVTRVIIGLVIVCGALLLADLTYHKHAEFGFDALFGFYPAFGFLAYLAIVLGAKSLRRWLHRDEDYYD